MTTAPQSLALRRLVDVDGWGTPFSLIDVGASGGIADYWSVFGDKLHAVGFDPYVTEVDRLNAAETRPHVRYEAAYVGAASYGGLFPPDLRNDPIRSRNDDPFLRVSAARAMRLLHHDYGAAAYNRGAPAIMATRSVQLDDVAGTAGTDFIKVDTDGHEIEVLVGAERLLSGSVLGLLVECQFHGPVHPYSNAFAAIDTFLRERGFSLFDLDAHRYSRSALPGRFVYDIPAQTVLGQIIWGDGLYLRDLGDPSYESKHGFAVTKDHVLKLAALFALFGLPDCAAELLVNRSALVNASCRTELLDLLTAEVDPSGRTYQQYVAAFERNPASLYPRGRS